MNAKSAAKSATKSATMSAHIKARVTAVAASLRSRFADFVADQRGVSALEFAITLPLMLALYLGPAEVTQGISVKRKVTLTARALADLSSQYTAITNADLTNIFNAGSAIIAPYTAGNLAETVSEIAIDSNGNATVVWSSTSNGTALTVGQTVTLPSGLAAPNSYLILGQASYSYNPTYGYVLTKTLTLSDQFYMRPRQSNSISLTGS
jgi:Flp pilus assembly protein TadG